MKRELKSKLMRAIQAIDGAVGKLGCFISDYAIAGKDANVVITHPESGNGWCRVSLLDGTDESFFDIDGISVVGILFDKDGLQIPELRDVSFVMTGKTIDENGDICEDEFDWLGDADDINGRLF